MSTWYPLDLQTLGSQPVMSKNLSDRWIALPKVYVYIPLSLRGDKNIYNFNLLGSHKVKLHSLTGTKIQCVCV